MKNIKKITYSIIACLLFMMVLLYGNVSVKAEETVSDFINMETAGELTVMFTYEASQPTIVFIAPSGKEYGETISAVTEFEFFHGEGFSTYKIVNAEAGQWKIRYDKKDNAEIEYSVVDIVEGLCIQKFEILSVKDNIANVQFSATKGEPQLYYNYTISAVVGDDITAKKQLVSGSAMTGETVTRDVELDLTSYIGYKLLLEATCTDGVEMYDYKLSTEFSYKNPNAPEAIKDTKVTIISSDTSCELDWYEYRASGWSNTYELLVFVDDETEAFYTAKVDDTKATFRYPNDAKKLRIDIYYKNGDVVSDVFSKELDLEKGEYLKINAEDITGNPQAELAYNSNNKVELIVKVNNEDGIYNICDEDKLYLPLEQGTNTIEAYFEGDENVKYYVKKDVVFNSIAPTIVIYEDIDGMVFKSDKAPITGKAEDAEILTINGKEVTLAENGEFRYMLELKAGENKITIEAKNAAGIGTAKRMTVTKKGTALEAMKETYLWLIISFCVGVVLCVIAFVKVGKKKEKNEKDSKEKKPMSAKKVFVLSTVISGILAVLSTGLYIWLHITNTSAKYWEILEESLQKAASYLIYEDTAFISMLVFGALFIVLLIITIVMKIIGKKSKSTPSELN